MQLDALPVVPMDDADFWQDPYPTLQRLREEHRVARTPDGLVAILRWDDAFETVRGTEFIQDGIEQLERMGFGEGDALHTWGKHRINTLEGPEHRRVRSLASWALTKRSADDLRPIVVRHVDDLLDQQLSAGEVDVLDLAYRLPRLSTMDFLGIGEEEFDGAVDPRGSSGLIDAFGRLLDPEMRAKVNAGIQKRMDHTAMLYERRRREPRDDLLTYLAQACDDQGTLSEGELNTLFSSIFGAGSSTSSIIGSAVMELVRNPEQAELLRSDPARWKRGASEEALRFHPAIDRIPKKAAGPTDAFGLHFEEGDRVTVLLKAANRDPEEFDDPDRFDIRREIRGVSHLTFGAGPHVCLGHAIARATIEETLAVIVERCSDMELVEEPRWAPFALENRLDAVRVRCRLAERAGR